MLKKPGIHSATAALVFMLFFLGMAIIQFSTQDLPDNDGFYHIKMAWLMRTEGLKPEFPWLPLTILNPREFYNHHFLFHVALIPFTLGNLVIGAKWAAVTFASLTFLAIWYLFSQQKISHAWLWSLALLGISDAFLYRMSIPRAQSLSLGVLAIGLVWMLNGQYRRLAILGFIYVWLYDAFPLLMALAVLHFIAILITEQRLEFRSIWYVGIGILLGVLINPYFPYNIIFAYRHMLPKLVDATSIRVGNEWYPYTTEQLLQNSLPAILAFVSSMIALGYAGRKMDLRTFFSMLVTLLFGLMLFQARRFVEYFPPFTLIFAAFAWQPLLQNINTNKTRRSIWLAFSKTAFAVWFQSARQELLRIWKERTIRVEGLSKNGAVFLFLAVLISILISIPRARVSLQDSKPQDLYAGASAWLSNNTPAGARVFQTDWDDFPRLFFYNTHNTYLIGLDPTYLQIADPDGFSEWEAISKGKIKNLSEEIPARFGAYYIHTDLKHSDFIKTAKQDKGLREVYRDKQAVIYEIIR